MPRPVKQRRICELPAFREFAPKTDRPCETVVMTLDEYEAIRLIDQLELSQEECAQQMEVARTTAQAIYISARKKLAEALVDGRQLRIEGGAYSVCPETNGCCGKNCRRRSCSMRPEGAEAAHGCPCMKGRCGRCG